MNALHKDLISIIIPTYGVPETLYNCVESVLAQNYENLEVIVVDDNNPETEQRIATEKVMKNLLSKDKRLKYIQHTRNMNGSAARNTGFKNSAGKFICFLDNDDMFLQNKLSKQLNFLKNNYQYNAVYCGYRVNGEDYYPKYEGNLKKELLLMEYEPVTSSLMFRRDAIIELNGFDEQFIRHQDYELMLRYFDKYQVSYVEDILIDKGRVDDQNIVRGQKLLDLKELYFEQFDHVISELEKEETNIRKKIYSRHYSKVFLTCMNHKYYKEGFKVFGNAIVNYPIFFSKDVIKRIYHYLS